MANRVYYARPIPMMGTKQDRENIAHIKATFPGASLDYAKTSECGARSGKKDMASYHKRVDKVRVVIAAESKPGSMSPGVFSEAQHGRHADKEVLVIRKKKLLPVVDLTVKGKRSRTRVKWASVKLGKSL